MKEVIIRKLIITSNPSFMTENILDQKDHLPGAPDLNELTRLPDETPTSVIQPTVTTQIAEVRRVCDWVHIDMGNANLS